ncbi:MULTISPECIES: TRAP transporter small permease [Modicisalibacter]|uniref:TRAP transporter small permease n=1 Tax=Modicisalibacter TaxID=574347 RepID=UPI00100A5F18|nr:MULTISPECIES: TRAP transporter small permease [Halomonadaceae]MBZ9558841.1 TRAP transporter small permease [Modicisalibacter sp. R2A 31.J]MBZ9575267.1 TRAP transporter small permease [Modicisalibacter sp. MOD 31.J]
MTQPSTSSGDSAKRPRGLMRALGVLDRGLGVIERIIVAGSVLIMAALMSAHVVGNILFGSGIAGTYEVTEMLIVVITFVGVGYAARHARHISMSAIYDQLSGRLRKALLILICLGTAVLMFYFAYKSVEYVVTLYGRGRTSASLHVPMWIVYLSLPIGFVLAGTQYLLTAARNLVSEDIYRSFNEKESYAEVPDEEAPQNGDASRDA